MTSDVAQWLIEIRTLQRQLVETSSERNAAFKSAANWRKLYETEAKQRRTETQQLKDTINELQEKLKSLNHELTNNSLNDHQASNTQQPDVKKLKLKIAKLDSETLGTKLVEALLRCDRLNQALQSEQMAHAQTRKSLTMALGDTIDMLSQNSSRSLAETTVESAPAHQQRPSP